MCEAHHGSDLSERNVSRVQGGVDLLGNLVIRPTRNEIVADEAPHPGEGGVVVRRPSEADGAQLSEVCVISGIGSRNRSAINQGSANHHGDGKSGPASEVRAFDALSFSLAFTLYRSAVGGPAPLVGAIGRMCEAHHGCDLSERNASRVQVGVDVLGNLVIRPTPPEVIADQVRHPDEGLVVVRRPSEADGAQLSEVCVISAIGSRNRGAINQGSANNHGDGKSGQPAR